MVLWDLMGILWWFYGDLMGFYGMLMGSTLWLCQYIAIENDHRNSEFSHETWWFSIVMLVYQRVHQEHTMPMDMTLKHHAKFDSCVSECIVCIYTYTYIYIYIYIYHLHDSWDVHLSPTQHVLFTAIEICQLLRSWRVLAAAGKQRSAGPRVAREPIDLSFRLLLLPGIMMYTWKYLWQRMCQVTPDLGRASVSGNHHPTLVVG